MSEAAEASSFSNTTTVKAATEAEVASRTSWRRKALVPISIVLLLIWGYKLDAKEISSYAEKPSGRRLRMLQAGYALMFLALIIMELLRYRNWAYMDSSQKRKRGGNNIE